MQSDIQRYMPDGPVDLSYLVSYVSTIDPDWLLHDIVRQQRDIVGEPGLLVFMFTHAGTGAGFHAVYGPVSGQSGAVRRSQSTYLTADANRRRFGFLREGRMRRVTSAAQITEREQVPDGYWPR